MGQERSVLKLTGCQTPVPFDEAAKIHYFYWIVTLPLVSIPVLGGPDLG